LNNEQITFDKQLVKNDTNGNAIPWDQPCTVSTTASEGGGYVHKEPTDKKKIERLECQVQQLKDKLDRLGAGATDHLTRGDVTAARSALRQHQGFRKSRETKERDYADDPDVAYFQRNMHNALKVPPEYLGKEPDLAKTIADLNVGPNDILVVTLYNCR